VVGQSHNQQASKRKKSSDMESCETSSAYPVSTVNYHAMSPSPSRPPTAAQEAWKEEMKRPLASHFNRQPDQCAGVMGVVTDLFNIVVAYGVYNEGRYEFAFTSRGSPVVPVEDYVTRLLLTFLNVFNIYEAERSKRKDPSKVPPDDIEITESSYHTAKQQREAQAKRDEANQNMKEEANKQNKKSGNKSAGQQSTRANQVMAQDNTYDDGSCNLYEDDYYDELDNDAMDDSSHEDDEFIEMFDQYDSYDNPVIVHGLNQHL
jgi:hypothetical protein